MSEINISLVFDFFLFLVIPFIFGMIVKRIGLPPVIGYITGGIFYGSFFSSQTSQETIKNFAYFGILLLLFTVGLETNFSRLFSFKKIILVAGTLQVVLSIIIVGLISIIFSFPPIVSFLIGIALSSSSTGLVAKIIQDRGEESSFLGEVAMGILLFQDLAFIPFMIIFSSFTNGQTLTFFNFIANLTTSLVKSTLIIICLFYLGQRFVPLLFEKIALISRELFNLFIIVFIFLVTLISLSLNIPTLVGVFIAGIFLSSSLQHHHIFAQIRPFRDLLAVIFFVYIGTNIRIFSEINFLPQIFLFTFLVVLAKAILILIIFLSLRFHTRMSFALAAYLFQIDEDAFILMSTALMNNLISKNDYLFIITSVLLTLIITPILINQKDDIYRRLRYFIKTYLPFVENFIIYRLDTDKSPIDQLNLKNHIVICGYGRVGSYIGRSLMTAGIPYLAIDYNYHIVEKARKQGVSIIYGDPTDIDILDYAQVDEAVVLVLSLPDRSSQEKIILNARKLNPRIFIISRVHKKIDHLKMRDLGANVVVQPEFEASISIIKKIFLLYHVDKQEIVNKIKRLKIEHGLS
ncbi:MAG: cation:proton antiporter [Patescibacteria group bacterium]|nr:cation:proton antiporter [Patescibacteria group bacterium]